MMKTRSSRPVFLSAAIMTILLGTVLIGGTFASGGIYAGSSQGTPENSKKYNVSLSYYNGNNYVSLLPPEDPISSTLWCPGKTEILYLKLENNEDFATSCTLTLNVTDTGFGNTLTYAVYDGDLKPEEPNSTTVQKPKSWTEFKSMAIELEKSDKPGKKEAVLTRASHKLLNQGLLDPVTLGDTRCLAVAIHMDENASSDYQGKTLKYDLVLQIDANYQPGETPTK